MNFAAAAASNPTTGAAPSQMTPTASHQQPQQQQQQRRRPPHPGPAPNKPPPSRSLSSVELANIVNGVRAPGVAAVPARISPSPNASVVAASASPSAPVPGPNASAATAPSGVRPAPSGKGKKSNVPAWHKSVFDMIQDDFPRTPSPMFSTLLTSRTSQDAGVSAAQQQQQISAQQHHGQAQTQQQQQQAQQQSSHRLHASDRRSRLASTASLDLDLDRIGTAAESSSDVQASRRAVDDHIVPSDPPMRSHHRRSVSINWTGDVSGLNSTISRSSSRSNLASSPPGSGFFGSNHPDIPRVSSPLAAVTSAPLAASASALPAAIGASGPSSPTQPLSPTGSVQRTGLPMSSPQASPIMPASQVTAGIGHGPNIGQHQHQLQQLNPYSLPLSGHEAVSQSQGNFEDLGVTGLPDYDYLYDQAESSIVPPANVGNPLTSGYANQAYSSSQPSLALGGTLGDGHAQPVGNTSQYANVFPGMGLFPSPFSTNASGVANSAGVAPVYSESFRDGLAAADNLKNMSIQMAAFINAQQQLYVAQMAQMAAITGNSSFSGNPTAFANPAIPGAAHLGHSGSGSHLRSPWDSRDPSPPAHRGYPRSKHHFDQYRGSGHMSSQKKNSGLDMGHKGRGGRNRRGHRAHDDVGVLGAHKTGDRVGLGGSSMGGGMQDSSHSRSPLLEEFRATSLSIGRSIGSVSDVGMGGGFGPGGVGQAIPNGREWQLSEIKDDVVEFATDQHGSRFIQQKLESASAQDKESILKHALTDAQRLMTDVFGNYVVQKLLDYGGANAVKLIAAELEGRMLVLSLHMYGCRVVQKALEVLESRARATLVRELDGHVLKCIRDQNGNHVIQKCVELVEPDAVQFIVDSVQGQAVVLAGHSYGCRVVQRILEHGAPNQKAPIMVEIMSSIADLIKDQYGNYVIQHVVEHGTVEERSVIMNLVREEVCQLSQHKFASNVVERCLQHGSLEERQVLIEILIVGEGSPNSSPLNHLVRDQFGNYVVQRVLDVARPPQRERVVSILRAQVPAIKKYSYGKHIIARLEEHQGGAMSGGYHHSQNAHNHANGHVAHRTERHVSPAILPVSVSHNMPQGHDFMYYE